MTHAFSEKQVKFLQYAMRTLKDQNNLKGQQIEQLDLFTAQEEVDFQNRRLPFAT